jgi:hypothetical protein
MGGDLDVASVPGSGSAFVLVLAGPAAIEPEVIAEALERALIAEEVGLEERAVLRAMGKRPRGGSPVEEDGTGPNLRVLDWGGQARSADPGEDARPGSPTLA